MSVKKYTRADGQYFKVTNKDSSATLMYGELTESNQLVTIHNVEFISEEQYESERPKPELPSLRGNVLA
ncbi:hypothetical protein APB90_09665 [Acinetobacter baumannii]|uniref:hypothetical protein n=1 Tax=Acinetobacter calcoaceticus/baumannii complex TaxID=909768 RepID=UPI0002CDBBA8|nr:MULTISPECIES: hypothetical protein [Acinetobacter calcoaceticus/baumannii complex]EKW5259532.1 hypothetical protein [Acinetobacter baumannii]ENV26779.1 hypothetical protein F962_01008 [Acinetobacter baumannii NIPH 190]EXR27393.1 hypothetical protein J694_2564 [Acinetobacter sp. 1281984]KQE78274.1 hypothetical protein APB90_09665 [Acinetobacter baumannii]MDA3555341.1 hypothetical protein [Acinetobacter baumannii]